MNKRILLVDDDEHIRRPLGEILRLAGYEVEAAADGFAALELFRKQPFDLVITDLVMPEKEGVETIIELRRIQPKVNIIAISGGGWSDPEDYLMLARGLGALATLAKPFPKAELLRVVAGALGQSGAALEGGKESPNI